MAAVSFVLAVIASIVSVVSVVVAARARSDSRRSADAAERSLEIERRRFDQERADRSASEHAASLADVRLTFQMSASGSPDLVITNLGPAEAVNCSSEPVAGIGAAGPWNVMGSPGPRNLLPAAEWRRQVALDFSSADGCRFILRWVDGSGQHQEHVDVMAR